MKGREKEKMREKTPPQNGAAGGLCVGELGELFFGWGMSLLGGFFEPVDGLRIILCYTPTVYIANAQVALRFGMPLLGGFLVPVNGLGMIL